MYIRQATQLQDNLNKALDSLHFKQYYSLNVVDSAQLSDSEPKQFLSMKLLRDISDSLPPAVSGGLRRAYPVY